METIKRSFQRTSSAALDWTTSRRSASRTATSSSSMRTPSQTWRSWRRSTCKETTSPFCHPSPSRAMMDWELLCWRTIILAGRASGWSGCTDADSVILTGEANEKQVCLSVSYLDHYCKFYKGKELFVVGGPPYCSCVTVWETSITGPIKHYESRVSILASDMKCTIQIYFFLICFLTIILH